MQPTLFVLLLLFAVQATAQVTIGTFETRNHGVAGQLVALSDRVLEVRNFVFDGEAPAAFFWADTNAIPSAAGFKLLDAAPSSTCGEVKLPGADGSQTFTIEFPEGFSLSSIAGGSISVWCEQFSANFGEVIIPTTLEGVADAESGPSLACAPAVEAEPVSIGNLITRNHDVEGEVVFISESVLEIRNFRFDGSAPAAFFWADTRSNPSSAGFKLLDAAPTNKCGAEKLPGADGSQTFTIEFPEGTTVRDVLGGSISVWCEQFSANFGEIIIPTTLEGVADAESGPSLACAPAVEAEPVSIGNLITRNHDVEGEVVFISESVLEIRNFRFDGSAPAAFFWADTRSNPSSAGFKLLDAAPTNKCGAEKLPGADGSQTFTIEFPEGTTVRDVLGGSISVWCEQFSANFGEIIIPSTLEGLASAADGPTLECSDAVAEEPPDFVSTPTGYNCEPLYEDLQVRWKVDGDNLDVELIGRIDESIYMSFGISGSDTKTDMLGADTIVCDFYQGIYRAIDFYMNSRAQCANGDGVCPDTVSDLNNDSTAVSGEQGAGLTIVRYTRPLTPTDLDGMVGGMTVDRSVSVEPGVATYIVWAVGPIDDDSGT